MGGHGRGRRTSDAGGHPVHADGVHPRRNRLAEPGHDRLGDDRRADRPVVHADEPVRRLHGSGGRHDARQCEARSFTIANLAQQQFQIAVTAGSTSLRATIGGPSDPAADLDLFVFNCTTGTCVLAGQSADGDSEESVTIANPAAGYVGGPGRRLQRPGRDDDVQLRRRVHERRVRLGQRDRCERTAPCRRVVDGPGTVTANAAPASGRVLLGNVQVRTDTNVLVGTR